MDTPKLALPLSILQFSRDTMPAYLRLMRLSHVIELLAQLTDFLLMHLILLSQVDLTLILRFKLLHDRLKLLRVLSILFSCVV